jgi:hypothetical protein
MSFSRSWLLFALFSVFLSACSAEVGTDEGSVESSQDPIINGTPAEANNSGIVYLRGPRGVCSGTLITNWTVLTAKHCVDDYLDNPTQLWLTMGSLTTFASDIFLHPEQFVDVAVVWLQTPLAMNNSTYGYRREIAMATPAQLDNGTLIIQGYGRNTATGGGGPNNLRWGLCASKERSARLTSCFPGPGGTIQHFGDSGGPGSVYAAGLPVVFVLTDCFDDDATGTPYECIGDTSSAWYPWAWWYLG